MRGGTSPQCVLHWNRTAAAAAAGALAVARWIMNPNQKRWMWNPFTLKFLIPEVESEFIQAREIEGGCSSFREIVFFATGLLTLVGLLVLFMLESLIGCVFWWGMLMSYGAGLFLSLFVPKIFGQRRNCIVMTARICGFGMALLAGGPAIQAQSLLPAVMCLFLNSPFCFLLVSTFACPLRMQHHLPVACTSLLLLCLVPEVRVCNSQSPHDTGLEGILLLRNAFDAALEMSMFGGVAVSEDIQPSCTGVNKFSILAFGILIPTGCTYCREVSARAAFLRTMLGPEHQQEIKELRKSCLEGAIWSLIFGLQASWILIRSGILVGHAPQ